MDSSIGLLPEVFLVVATPANERHIAARYYSSISRCRFSTGIDASCEYFQPDRAADPGDVPNWSDILDRELGSISNHTIKHCRLWATRRDFGPGDGGEMDDCPTVAVIKGVKLETLSSRGVNKRATVTVLPGKGYITFAPTNWNKAFIIMGRRVIAGHNITFRAYPEDVNDILANFRFQSYHIGLDVIQIIISYGDCSKVDLSAPSLSLLPEIFETATCQVLRTSIDVHVEAAVRALRVNEDENTSKQAFPWQIFLCWFGYPLL